MDAAPGRAPGGRRPTIFEPGKDKVSIVTVPVEHTVLAKRQEVIYSNKIRQPGGRYLSGQNGPDVSTPPVTLLDLLAAAKVVCLRRIELDGTGPLTHPCRTSHLPSELSPHLSSCLHLDHFLAHDQPLQNVLEARFVFAACFCYPSEITTDGLHCKQIIMAMQATPFVSQPVDSPSQSSPLGILNSLDEVMAYGVS